MITDGLRRSKDNDFREAVFYAVSPGPYGENGSFLLLFYLPWKQENQKILEPGFSMVVPE